jgi:uncharacterized membrane protein
MWPVRGRSGCRASALPAGSRVGYASHMPRPFVAYLAVVAGILVVDGLWLGVVAKRFYAKQLGYLMAPGVQWWAAALFYLLFAAGVVFFVVLPLVEGGSFVRVFLTGAFFGLVAYATYDLTNQALVRSWPVVVTIIDLTWGAFLTGLVSVISVATVRFLR